MFANLRRMKLVDKFIILFCGLVILSILLFLSLYFRKPTVANSHRGSLNKAAPALNTPDSQVVSGPPKLISIASLNMSLDVIPGSQDKNGNWTLTPDKTQYALISPAPNNKEGNTVIYGHATKNIFGHLSAIKKGDIATITTNNGYTFRYIYEGTYSVNPYDFSIFEYRGSPILTLQTCSGSFFQNRQMYQFSYLSYSKS